MLPLGNGVNGYVKKRFVPKPQLRQLSELSEKVKEVLLGNDFGAERLVMGFCFFGVAGILLGVKNGVRRGISTSTRFNNAMDDAISYGIMGAVGGAFLGYLTPAIILTAPVTIPFIGGTYWYARHVQHLNEKIT